MSVGLVAFLWGVAFFLSAYALVGAVRGPLASATDAGFDDGEALAAGAGTIRDDSGFMNRYVRPALRNFVPESAMSAQLKGDRADKVNNLLISAGNPWKLTASEYIGMSWLSGLIGVILGLGFGVAIGFEPGLTGAFGGVLGYWFPRYFHRRRRSLRIAAAEKQLPEALDLLRITIASGQQFQSALAEVSQRLPDGLVRNELRKTVNDMRAGKSTSRSLQDLARRVPAEPVEMFARTVAQGERLGADPTETLDSMSDMIRGAYEARLDKRIASLSTTMFLPILIGLVPAIFIIIAAPAVSSIITGLS